mgnify:FL=1
MGVSIQNAMQYLSICKCDTGTPVQHAFPTRSTRESLDMEVGRVGKPRMYGVRLRYNF